MDEEPKEVWRSLREAVLWNCYGAKESVAVLDKHFGIEEEVDNG